MKSGRALAVFFALCLPLWIAQAQAADIKVMSTTALKGVLDQLVPQFEKSTGNKIDLVIGPSAAMKSQIDQGAVFDIVIVTPSLTDALAAAGKIDPATRVTIAHAGLGVAVRAGAAKPDVSTPDALKRALLAAKSIGFNGQGASRAGIEAMMAKLGIADDLKPKIALLAVSAPEAVAKGEVEIGLSPVSEIVAVSGAEVAGAFPADLQSYLVIVGSVSRAARNADAAKSLIKFLAAPANAPVLKAKGMDPGQPGS